jgi:di/tricarboxylate transporter
MLIHRDSRLCCFDSERRSSEYRTIPASQRLWNFFVFYKRSTLFFVVATIYMLGISAAIPAMHPVMEVEGEEVELTWQSYFAIECTFLALLFFLNDSPPDLVGLVISITLVLFKVVTIDDAIGGFSSSSVLAIGVLFVVAKGLENTGAISKLLVPVMGESKVRPLISSRLPTLLAICYIYTPCAHSLPFCLQNLTVSLLRMTFPVAIMSAFMNNTPVVAILIPVLQQWAPRIGHSPKKFLIPLSYSSMLGGTLTLLGTSTNLVLQDLVQKSCLPDGTIDGTEGNVPCIELGMFTMAPVGICMVIVGLLFMAFTAGCLLPGGQSMGATRDDVDEKMLANHYPLAMVVSDESVLVGKDLLGAGLLSMKGLVVISIATKSISYGGGNMISGKELDDYQLAEGDSLHLAVTGDAISLIRSLEGTTSHTIRINLTITSRLAMRLFSHTLTLSHSLTLHLLTRARRSCIYAERLGTTGSGQAASAHVRGCDQPV